MATIDNSRQGVYGVCAHEVLLSSNCETCHPSVPNVATADWQLALTEYAQLREEIGRLEETSECSCDGENFHTCALCTETASLDQSARSLMNLWGDTWAVKLYEMRGA